MLTVEENPQPASFLLTLKRSARMCQGIFFVLYANNEPKSVLARGLGDCLDNQKMLWWANFDFERAVTKI